MPSLFNTVPTGTSKADRRYGALILAAGLSSRMAGFKPLTEIAGKPLIEHATGLFRDSAVEDIVTVVGHRAEALIPHLEAASSRYVVNESYQDGMFSSIQKGVAELKDVCDAFFLLPVDIPCVRPATILRLRNMFEEFAPLVCYPEFRSRRGHPPLIGSSLIDQVIAYTGEGGMRGFLGKYQQQSVTVAVADPFILLDVDTEEDLALLEKEISRFSF